MIEVTQRVREVQVRQQRQWIWNCASAGLLAGGAIGTLMAALRIVLQGSFSWVWILLAVLVPVITAICVAVVKATTMQLAARTIDDRCGLKDRTETALQFLAASSRSDTLRQLQVEDAESHLQAMNPVTVAPIRAPRSWSWGLLLGVVSTVLSFFPGEQQRVEAGTEVNPVVTSVVDLVAEGLNELEQFQDEKSDPELEAVIKEIARHLEGLKEPGLAPKEALAKLSEMEAALEHMQQQIANASTEADLQDVGKALSLAESMASAGQAMARGDFDKAADELAKMNLPKLDRKTQKAVSEKLEQIQADNSTAGQKQELKDSLEKAKEGMNSGNNEMFQEGMKGLSSECRKQSQKKQISELLKKQARTLSESKSEFESEARSQAQSNRKGGKQAGKGSTELAGNKTADRSTKGDMKLKGEDSGSGDSETESELVPEQEQVAERQYRQNIEKYEALRESVLESESIPLGHRQAIRRYFELIRPTAKDLDRIKSDATSTP